MSRTPESTDGSGKLIQDYGGGRSPVAGYRMVKDEPGVAQALEDFAAGLAQRSCSTAEPASAAAIAPTMISRFEKELSGLRSFACSAIRRYAVIGVSAGRYGHLSRKVVISMPGSTNAVRLAMSKLVLPEIRHSERGNLCDRAFFIMFVKSPSQG